MHDGGMARTALRRCLAAATASILLPVASAAQAPADEVTIYHCTDAAGQPVIRDSPCAAGQAQRRVTTMQRPVDPPRPAAPEPPPSPPAPAPASSAPAPGRTVIAHAPTPMYECTTPDGDTYTSDDGRGNPRWVPMWTVGYGTYPGHSRRHLPPPVTRPPTGAPVRPAAAGSSTGSGFRFDGIGRPSPALPPDQPRPQGPPPVRHDGGHNHRGAVPYAAGGTWVQDSCRPLAQYEVCELLGERSRSLWQRYNHALQSEQREITAERRRIARRMETDC